MTLRIDRSSESAPPFLLAIDVEAGRITVHGELDSYCVPSLDAAVRALGRSAGCCRTIDLAAVTFCDIAGVRALAVARRDAAQLGYRTHMHLPRPWLRRLVAMAEDLMPSVPVTPASPRPPCAVPDIVAGEELVEDRWVTPGASTPTRACGRRGSPSRARSTDQR